MELTLDQALQKGIEAHKAGKVQEADRLYTAILKANPKHPDANHNMGVLAVGVGKVEAALPFFKSALEVNQTIAQFWLSYIDALIKLNRMDDAKAVFDQSKSNGLQGEGFDQLEQRLDVSKNPDATMIGHSEMKDPPQNQIQALIDLYSKGQFRDVLSGSSQLLSAFPNSVSLLNVQGAANHELGKFEEAIEAYTKALSIKPNYAQAYNNLGIAFQCQGKLELALESFSKALSINPDNAEAYYNSGNVFRDQAKLEEAIEAYNNAISIKPDYSKAYNNTIDLLKTYSPKSKKSHNLFKIDSKIKKLSPRLLHATSNIEIIDNLLEGLSYISEDSFKYKTPLSQIYKRNTVDLNCKRHTKIFDTRDIIPEFCFGCFKVQVEVDTFIDLVKLTTLFYKFNLEEDLTKKTIIELRPNISGYYKGLIYCKRLG